MTEETRKQRKDAGKRRALSNIQRFQIMETLKANGTKDGEKWWLFSDGWSDERIAKQFDCGETQVASIRRDCFGDLKPTTANGHSPVAVMFAEIKALKERVAALEGDSKLLDRIKALEAAQTTRHVLHPVGEPPRLAVRPANGA
jgi:hypothetical protein